MTKRFKAGDHVSWNSEAGRVSQDRQGAYQGCGLQRVHTPREQGRTPVRDQKQQDRPRRSAQGKGASAHASVIDRKRHMAYPFFTTIGHSTRPVEKFVDLLQGAQNRTRDRCPQNSALAHESSIQLRHASRNPTQFAMGYERSIAELGTAGRLALRALFRYAAVLYRFGMGRPFACRQPRCRRRN